jgi:glucose 1-dehydrogenase
LTPRSRCTFHNKAVIGTVNAHKRHFESAHAVLVNTDRAWLGSLLSTCVALDDWRCPLEADRADIKSLITFDVV